MNIYEALKTDHRKFESLLRQLEQAAQTGNVQWKALLEELRSGLIPHAHAEEAVFYNALREHDESKGIVAHSYGEHAMAESEVRMLSAAKLIDANWHTMVQKLRKDLESHILNEETRVFEAARKVLSDDEARQIGDAFMKLKVEMTKDSESLVASTMEKIADLLPARFVGGFRKHFSRTRKTAA